MEEIDWQGEGWYAVGVWVCPEGRYKWPEAPEAYWCETREDLGELCTDDLESEYDIECEFHVNYFGSGEYPDKPVQVAAMYPDFDYREWARIRRKLVW